MTDLSDAESVYGYKSPEEFLTVHRHYLVKRISANDFLDWLRSMKVFNLVDQEDVEFRCQTPSDKNGRLIDLILRKGRRGFEAFMEVVEYEYAEIFEKLTKTKPRKPPLGYNPSWKVRRKSFSVEVVKTLSELLKKASHVVDSSVTDKIMHDLAQENEILKNWYDQMESKCNELRKNKFEWICDRERLEDEINMMRVAQREDRERMVELTTQRDNVAAEKLTVDRRLDELIRTLSEEKGNLEREKRMSRKYQDSCIGRPSDAEIDKLRQENRNLHERMRKSITSDPDATEQKTAAAEQENLQEKIQNLSDLNEQLNKEVDALRSDKEALQREREKMANEMMTLKDQLVTALESDKQHKKRFDEFVNQMKTAQEDRNKAWKDRRSLQEKCEDHLELIDKYTLESRNLYERIQDLEKENTALLREKDHLEKNLEKMLGSPSPPAEGATSVRSTARFAVLFDESDSDVLIHRFSHT